MRKTICCISIRPDEVYQQRVVDGLQSQCERYGYNLAVFSPLVNISHYFKDYLQGEMNLLDLPDFNSFDAIVIVAIPFIDMGDTKALTELYKKIRSKTDKPVVVLDYELEGAASVYTDDITAFRVITKHVVEEHGCRNIYLLSGQEGFDVSERRVKGFAEGLADCGLPFDESKVFYGNFWYTSGEELAGRIISGELPLPEAIICAGDHSAIGVANALSHGGIRIPEQVIVTGYEATLESVTNRIGITSYIADISFMAASAINRIKDIIEPERQTEEISLSCKTGLLIAESCGCKPDTVAQKNYLQSALYRSNRNYGDTEIKNNTDIANLMESYMLENLTKSETPLECLKLIYSSTYLIQPYGHFYLCLRPDWLDTEVNCTDGYPNIMRCVIHAAPEYSESHKKNNIHCRNDDRDNFETKLMLPALWEETEKPSVFYFSPVHFSSNTFGYAILQCNLTDNVKLTHVFNIWLRNVNSALEMIRARNRLVSYSLVDSMTKLFNRRGMEMRINDLISIAEPGDMLLAMVIDMDGLKRTNDTYGHNEGDYAIMTIASVVRCITEGAEVASRAGGDEFYILGVGNYTQEQIDKKVERFNSVLADQNKMSMKPFEISASVGYAIVPLSEEPKISRVIAKADACMYINKTERKKQRGM